MIKSIINKLSIILIACMLVGMSGVFAAWVYSTNGAISVNVSPTATMSGFIYEESFEVIDIPEVQEVANNVINLIQSPTAIQDLKDVASDRVSGGNHAAYIGSMDPDSTEAGSSYETLLNRLGIDPTGPLSIMIKITRKSGNGNKAGFVYDDVFICTTDLTTVNEGDVIQGIFRIKFDVSGNEGNYSYSVNTIQKVSSVAEYYIIDKKTESDTILTFNIDEFTVTETLYVKSN